MPLTNAAAHKPTLAPHDDVSLAYRGIRGSATAAAATVTLTISNAQVAKEWGYADRKDGSVQLGATGLLVYSDTAGATLTVKSGTDTIWTTFLGVGTVYMDLRTALMADQGKDLVFVVASATSKCSVAMVGQGLYTHVR
jgi:hypothetical protein